MRVIAFTGLPGSGKSVAVEVARARGIPVVRMGRFVLDEVARRGLPLEEGTIGPVATEMRNTHGSDVWARRTVEALNAGAVPEVGAGTERVVVDGVRSLDEVKRFRDDLGTGFILVAIEAPGPERHARILGRGRVDDAAEHALVLQRDEREKAWGIEKAMAAADHTVHNEGDLPTFRHDIDGLLDRLLTS